MSASSLVLEIPECGLAERARTPRCVARQPILDLHGRVHAYELVFRGGMEGGGGELAEVSAAFGLGKPSELKKLTGGLLAYVKWPAEMRAEELARALAASVTVLEMPAEAGWTPERAELALEIEAAGFRLAAGDFGGAPESEALVDHAGYVKVDFGRTGPEARREALRRLQGRGVARLAGNVQTQAEYRQAREEGFTLFEGFYFCQPAAVKNRRAPVNQMLRIEILQAIQKQPMNLPKVSELVKRDGPLAFQLLRLVNSPLWAVRQEVTSIQGALLAVGEDAFRRLAMLAIATEFNGDQPAELLCMAMVRGRFCEQGAAGLDLDPFGQYLLGLLSLLPAMMGQPMSQVAPALPLNAEIREALLGAGSRTRALLGWLECLERGDWAGCDAAAEAEGLDQALLARNYVAAVTWAETALHAAG